MIHDHVFNLFEASKQEERDERFCNLILLENEQPMLFALVLRFPGGWVRRKKGS